MKYVYILKLVFLVFFSCGKPASSSSIENQNKSTNTNDEVQQAGYLVGDNLQTFEEYFKEDSVWTPEFKVVESAIIDFNKDGFLDEIVFLRISLFKKADGTSFMNEDPGDYHLIKITDGNTKKEFEFFNGDGWIKKYYLDRLSKENQGVRSDYFVNYSSGKNHLLIFEGFTYGSGSSTRTIINYYDTEPILVYNANKKIREVNSTLEGLSVVINEAAAEEMSTADEEDIYRVDKWLHLINKTR
jgi:hypothetical protein